MVWEFDANPYRAVGLLDIPYRIFALMLLGFTLLKS